MMNISLPPNRRLRRGEDLRVRAILGTSIKPCLACITLEPGRRDN